MIGFSDADMEVFAKMWMRKDEGKEGKKKKDIQEEREKLRRWDHCWEKPGSYSDLGSFHADCELDEWQVQDQRTEVQKRSSQAAQNTLDITDLGPMSHHLDLFKHIYRDWNDGSETELAQSSS